MTSATLRAAWRRLLGTLWFVPFVLVVAAIVLAQAMVALSVRLDARTIAHLPLFFAAGAQSSLAMLSAVASGMITVAGLTFSLMMVAVTQASNQYSSRVLRTFMNDRSNQVALGTFSGTFAYCLVVMRTIRIDVPPPFVPTLAVAVGIALSIVGVGLLVWFVHHVAASLEASSVIARIVRETLASIETSFPQSLTDDAPPDTTAAAAAAAAVTHWHPVPAARTGYVQVVDEARLVDAAVAGGRLVRMERAVGDFVIEGMPLAAIAADTGRGGLSEASDAAADVPAPPPASGGPDADALVARVADAWTIGHFRTIEQDAAFGIRQLLDISMRALSAAINDTTTAVAVVDYMGVILLRLVGRRVESPVRVHEGVVRVLATGPTYEGLLRFALDELRHNAAGNVSVLGRLLEMLGVVGGAAPTAYRRALVREQVELVWESVARSIPSAHDLARLGALADAARLRCGPVPAIATVPAPAPVPA